jgi:HAD superfamily hydrolase (TIGR01509 family)
MDGVLLDSGHAWNEVLQELFRACDRPWGALDQQAFAGGDNSRQWASYLRRMHALPWSDDEIVRWVTDRILERFRVSLPLLPGAEAAVARLGARYKLGLASSSPREVIAYVLRASGMEPYFTAWVSSDDVACGKPAPDVYLHVCALLGTAPDTAVAIEDSPMGVASAKAAGLRVIAIPHVWFPLTGDELATADLVLSSLAELQPETVAAL